MNECSWCVTTRHWREKVLVKDLVSDQCVSLGRVCVFFSVRALARLGVSVCLCV